MYVLYLLSLKITQLQFILCNRNSELNVYVLHGLGGNWNKFGILNQGHIPMKLQIKEEQLLDDKYSTDGWQMMSDYVQLYVYIK